MTVDAARVDEGLDEATCLPMNPSGCRWCFSAGGEALDAAKSCRRKLISYCLAAAIGGRFAGYMRLTQKKKVLGSQYKNSVAFVMLYYVLF